MLAWGLIGLVAVALAYVRWAPSDPVRWHEPVVAERSGDFGSGAVRVLRAGPGALARIDAAARALPRTSVLAGTVAEGRITYVTRSRWFGFPDYTTVEQEGDVVRMLARLRFGRSDLGVNGQRLDRLQGALQP